MAFPIPERLYTPEEYLEFERASDEKHEWLDGRIYPLGEPPKGVTTINDRLRHSIIVVNLTAELRAQLRGKPCQVLSNEIKILTIDPLKKKHVPPLYQYPDLTIVCDRPIFDEEITGALSNPKVIIEVLLPSTKDFDSGTKFTYYQLNPSFTDYILVFQDELRVEHLQKQSDNTWLMNIEKNIREEVYISSINARLKLSDVYDRISFSS